MRVYLKREFLVREVEKPTWGNRRSSWRSHAYVRPDLVAWLKEHLPGRYEVINSNKLSGVHIDFKTEADAMVFQLAWWAVRKES